MSYQLQVDLAQPAWRFLVPPESRGRLDVLLVEDDRDIAEMYRRRLAADGLNVEVTESALAALTRLRQAEVGLVLLDIRLPDLDGFEVLQAMRAEPELARIPVLMLTNYGEPSTVRRAAELGAAEYLVKASVTPTEVAERVRAHLGRGGPLH